MERRDEIRDLYLFNHWANARVRGAVATLSEDECSSDLKSSYPSVRDTMLHIMASEWVWLMRWQGTSPTGAPLSWQDYTREQIAAQWAEVEAGQLDFIERHPDPALEQLLSYTTFRGEPFTQPLWQLLRHVVNHSSYHRGQITTMLRQLGHSAVATDLVVYYRQSQPAARK